MRSLNQLLRAIGRRLLRRSDVVIVRCRNPQRQPARLLGLTVVRLNQWFGVDEPLLENTMRKAGELGIDMQARFHRGDEFFALRGSHGIVSFTWVTYADRLEGSLRVHAAPERALIYNSFTMPQHRGRGLLSLLVQHMQSVLVAEGRTDFVAGIHHGNASSLRAYDKSRFAQVAVARGMVLFNRFKFARPALIHDSRANLLFATTQAPSNVFAAAAVHGSGRGAGYAPSNTAPNAGYAIERSGQQRARASTHGQQ